MLRVALRSRLASSSALAGILTGGIYPVTDADPNYLSRDTYPAAFDAWGDLLPVALVRDSGSFNIGPYGARGASQVVDILLWQQRGRDSIDAALRDIRRTLEPAAQVTTANLWVYQLRFAGDGPSVRDMGLNDAEHGWQRWQAATVVKG
jgi:hypothetical protein